MEEVKVKRKSLCKKGLRGALEDIFSWSTEDKICFTYLSILATIIIGEDDKKELPLEIMDVCRSEIITNSRWSP